MKTPAGLHIWMPVTRMLKQPVHSLARCRYDFSIEPGIRVFQRFNYLYSNFAYMHDVKESRGRNMRDAGILTTTVVKKDGQERMAYRDESGTWWWVA